MLPKEIRLKKEDFKELKKYKVKFLNSENFTLKIYSAGFNPTRFAVVISSSFLKKAIKRNKLKRQIKGILLEILENIKPGFALVFFVKKEIKVTTFKELKKEIQILLKDSSILK